MRRRPERMTGNAYHDAHCVRLFGTDKGRRQAAGRERERDSMTTTILIEALARRARSLVDGMQARTGRLPDIADYRAAFEDELSKFNTPMDSSTSAFDKAVEKGMFKPRPQRAESVNSPASTYQCSCGEKFSSFVDSETHGGRAGHVVGLVAANTKPIPVPVRAKLVPDSDRPSLGSSIGQQTGGTARSDADEAKRILSMIENVHADVIEAVCGGKAAQFISEMQVRRWNGGPLCVTGKQLFWLRELKDKLVDKGYV
jgi:hypothetical protein